MGSKSKNEPFKVAFDVLTFGKKLAWSLFGIDTFNNENDVIFLHQKI